MQHALPMKFDAKSIRAFIGSKDFTASRNFYRDLGFEESIISKDMSLFKVDDFGFYLQAAYVKKWVDNTMMFLEVEDVDRVYERLVALDLQKKYKNVRITGIKTYDWGKECFIHDPSGILWHFGEFNS